MGDDGSEWHEGPKSQNGEASFCRRWEGANGEEKKQTEEDGCELTCKRIIYIFLHIFTIRTINYRNNKYCKIYKDYFVIFQGRV